MKRYHHITAAGVAIVICAGLILDITFGWRSISQRAVNETLYHVSAGGRLHDDFDGSNKDVYAENYTTQNEGGLPLYVRIRLDEYMETGEEAGENRGDVNRKATPVIAGTKIDDVSTWVTHIPGDTDPSKCTGSGASLHDHWSWVMGGSTVYMPTFNKNADSLKADVNGTYEGKVVGDSVHYDDYQSYTLGQTVTEDAVYDADDNDVEDANVTMKNETHTATNTQTAVVMTMKQWKAMGSPAGKYWVYDTDGWAYWAEALQPGEATGLLLDKVIQTSQLSKKSYYAINVVAQFATADDWGSEDNPVGFYEGYDPGNGVTGPTKDALFLLHQAAGKDYQLTITTADAARSGSDEQDMPKVRCGSTLAFKSKVTCMGRAVEDQSVTWRVKGAASNDTKISADGVLTIGKDESAEVVQVTAVDLHRTSAELFVTVIH